MEEIINMEKFVKENKITVYKIAKMLGKNPDSASYNLRKKIKGEMVMDYNEYVKIISILNQLTNKKVEENNFNFKINNIILE